MHCESVSLADLHIPQRTRKRLDADQIATLAESMKRIGLKTPITITLTEAAGPDGSSRRVPTLVAGLHRVKAAETLGWTTIEAMVADEDPVKRELWEIAENLHRAELTILERAEHMRRWEELRGSQSVPSWDTLDDSPAQRKKKLSRRRGGIRETADAMGWAKSEVQRFRKIASITAPAKRLAVEAGLDNHQVALLAIAGEKTPEAQEARVRRPWIEARE